MKARADDGWYPAADCVDDVQEELGTGVGDTDVGYECWEVYKE